ncbi:MAG: nucleotidyltransferase domain-containing protein [Bdellovibrio sp.]|nr:nucleotidyltransferase domain-containing protein [Bdellovibrio sp.]
MKFGLTKEQYDFIITSIVQPLESLGSKVFCFGSRARGDFKPYSDLDIMVENNDRDLSKEINAIRDMTIESNFPYKIDLVLYSEFAESYKANYSKDKRPFTRP